MIGQFCVTEKIKIVKLQKNKKNKKLLENFIKLNDFQENSTLVLTIFFT